MVRTATKTKARRDEASLAEDTTADSIVNDIFAAEAEDTGIQLFEGIAIPETTRERQSKYPWDKLAVGASFFVPNAKLDSFSTLVSTRNKKSDAKFIVRKWTGERGVQGVMVWRKS